MAIGEIFSSGGETLYKNPSDQTVVAGTTNWGQIFFSNHWKIKNILVNNH